MSYAKVINGSLNMRQESSLNSSKITLIPNGARIAVLEKGVVWCKAAYNQYTGYVMTKYLQFEKNENLDDSHEEVDTVSITLDRETAILLYKALKTSLNF